MRALVAMAAVVAASAIAHAEPCVTVSATDPGDAAVVRRALLATIPAAPRACLDVALDTTQRESASEVTLVATVHVMISDDRGRMTSVVSGGATAHVAHGSRKLPMYRRDALDQAARGLAPAIRARLIPRARPGA